MRKLYSTPEECPNCHGAACYYCGYKGWVKERDYDQESIYADELYDNMRDDDLPSLQE
jgi:hypothetical protein